MSRPLNTVRAFIGEHALIEPGSAILIGLSGGVDSVVLAEMLHRLEFEVAALHVNYKLRGRESDEDERFVRVFCDELGLDLHVESFDTEAAAEQRGTSVQETARELRYEALERRARRIGLGHVAVGHHRDDQAETVLLNLLRGTGPEGLAGMRLSRAIFVGSDVNLIRPLLCLGRRDIEAYARERGLSWREDASNAKPAYRRSAIRGHVLPAIEAHFGAAAIENIVRSAEVMRGYVDGGLLAAARSAFASAATQKEPGLDSDTPMTRSGMATAASGEPTARIERSAAITRNPAMPDEKAEPENVEATTRRPKATSAAVGTAFGEAGAAFGETAVQAGQLDITVLRHLEPALRGRVVLEAIRRWMPGMGATRATVDEIESLLDAQPGRRLVHPSGVVWRERDRLLFMANRGGGVEAGTPPGAAGRNGSSPREVDGAVLHADSSLLRVDHPVTTPAGVVELALNVQPPDDVAQCSSNEEYVDADRLREPVTVRRWRPGDRFIPLGMSRPKKVSDFLTDEKVPSHSRADVLVVQAREDIVWVVGHRISEAVRLRQDTRHVARLRFHPAENTAIKSA